MPLAPVVVPAETLVLNVMPDPAAELQPDGTPERVHWCHGTNAAATLDALTREGWRVATDAPVESAGLIAFVLHRELIEVTS